MDDADISQERLEREEEARRRYHQPVEITYYTSCRWCGDDTENGVGCCCKDCHTDWHKHEATLNRLSIRR